MFRHKHNSDLVEHLIELDNIYILLLFVSIKPNCNMFKKNTLYRGAVEWNS